MLGGGDCARILNHEVNADIFGQPELGNVRIYCKYDFEGKLLALYLDEEAAKGLNLLKYLSLNTIKNLEKEAETIFHERKDITM